jgi:drug/metabolite transporter (DMT)-like permease
MVGVCLTVIGLLRVVIAVRKSDTFADDLLAGDAVLFLAACLLSYWSLRRRSVRRLPRVEKIADALFVAALLVMVSVCVYITYAVAVT